MHRGPPWPCLLRPDGLLTLGVGASSVVLSALSMPQQAGKLSESVDWLQKVWSWRHPVGESLIYDGPDHYQALDNQPANKLHLWLPRFLSGDLVETGREGIINLNAQSPPQEMVELARGPLFKHALPSSDERLEQFTGDFLEEFASNSMPGIRVHFHLAERDFEEGKQRLLRRAVCLVEAGAAVSFVFDRPRKPHCLGEGLDRNHKASLMSVGIHLPQLADQMGSPRTPERFLSKLVILVRLALTAGTQKRAFLRRYSEGPFAEGFLLEKARLVICARGARRGRPQFLRRGLLLRANPTAAGIRPANPSNESGLLLRGRRQKRMFSIPVLIPRTQLAKWLPAKARRPRCSALSPGSPPGTSKPPPRGK